MARPRKESHERRLASVRSDLTLAEKHFVQQQAIKAGLSEAEYTRRRVLGQPVPAPAYRLFDPALVTEINRLGLQVRALGQLTNQVALYCHTDRSIPDGWEVLPSEISRLAQLVEQTLAKVLRDGA